MRHGKSITISLADLRYVQERVQSIVGHARRLKDEKLLRAAEALDNKVEMLECNYGIHHHHMLKRI